MSSVIAEHATQAQSPGVFDRKHSPPQNQYHHHQQRSQQIPVDCFSGFLDRQLGVLRRYSSANPSFHSPAMSGGPGSTTELSTNNNETKNGNGLSAQRSPTSTGEPPATTDATGNDRQQPSSEVVLPSMRDWEAHWAQLSPAEQRQLSMSTYQTLLDIRSLLSSTRYSLQQMSSAGGAGGAGSRADQHLHGGGSQPLLQLVGEPSLTVTPAPSAIDDDSSLNQSSASVLFGSHSLPPYALTSKLTAKPGSLGGDHPQHQQSTSVPPSPRVLEDNHSGAAVAGGPGRPAPLGAQIFSPPPFPGQTRAGGAPLPMSHSFPRFTFPVSRNESTTFIVPPPGTSATTATSSSSTSGQDQFHNSSTSLASITRHPVVESAVHVAGGTVDEVGFVNINHYALVEEIGRGQYGRVFQGIDLQSGGLVAIKAMDCALKVPKHRFGLVVRSSTVTSDIGYRPLPLAAGDGERNSSSSGKASRDFEPSSAQSTPPAEGSQGGSLVLREIAIMKRLNHKNIVMLREVIHDEEEELVYMVMQYVDKGPIAKLADDGTCSTLPEEQIRSFLRQAATGLQYLHNHSIIHRDIKPENILWSSDGICCLADFGVSAVVRDGQGCVDFAAGTQTFFSPEMCRGKSDEVHKYGRQSDIWALGVTFYAVRYGRLPYYSTNVMELVDAILHKPLEFPDDEPRYPHDDELNELLSGMLRKDPAERLSLADVRRHPYVQTSSVQSPTLPDGSTPGGSRVATFQNPTGGESPSREELRHAIRRAPRWSLFQSPNPEANPTTGSGTHPHSLGASLTDGPAAGAYQLFHPHRRSTAELTEPSLVKPTPLSKAE